MGGWCIAQHGHWATMREVGGWVGGALLSLGTGFHTSSFTSPLTPQLLDKGHSRVPIFKETEDNVCGMLLVKKLIQLDPEDCTPVQTLEGSQTPPPSSLTTTPLYEQLNLFQTGRSES